MKVAMALLLEDREVFVKRIFGIIWVLLSIILLSTSVFGQSMVLTTKFKSDYIGSNGGDFYSKPFQPTDIWIQGKNGWYGAVWASTGYNSRFVEFDKEVDVTVGRVGKCWSLDCSVDTSYYFVMGKDVANVNGELSKEMKPKELELRISPFIRGEFYTPTQRGGPRSGFFVSSGFRSSTKIFDPRITFMLEAWVKKDTGNFGFDSALLGQGYVGVSFALTEKVKLVPGVKYSEPLSHVQDGRKTKFTPEVGLVYVLR